MADPVADDASKPRKGMSLEEVAKMGPLPGVVADDEAEQRGENQSDAGGRPAKSVMLPGPSSDNSVH
jgi:hypothetical protein